MARTKTPTDEKFEKQDFNQTINTLAMASPFTLEEKQALLETKDLNLSPKDPIFDLSLIHI